MSAMAQRFARGFLATLLAQVITAVGNLVLVPIFLAAWGDTLYGEWLVLYSAVAYMAVVDMGMQMYVVNRLHQAFARRDLQDYHASLHSALAMSLTIAAGVIALALLFFAVAPVGRWLELVHVGDPTLLIVATLLAVQLVGAIPAGLVVGIYRTVGEYPRGVMLANLQRTSHLVLTGTVVSLGGDVTHVAAVQLLPLLSMVGWALFDVRRRHPTIRVGLAHANRRLAISFLAPSFFFFLIQVSGALVIQGTTLVVGAVLGTSVVVVFVTTRTLANLVTQLTGAVNATLWPDLTVLEATGRYDTLRMLQRLASKVVLAMTLAAAIFLFFNGERLHRLWTGGHLTYDPDLMTVLLLHLLFVALLSTTTMVLVVSNHHRRAGILSFAAAALGVALAVPAARVWGLVGVAAAVAVADVVFRGTPLVREACRLIDQPLSRLLFDVVVRGLPVAALASSLFLGVDRWLSPAGWLGLGLTAAATGVVVMVATWFLWLDAPERARIIEAIRKRSGRQS